MRISLGRVIALILSLTSFLYVYTVDKPKEANTWRILIGGDTGGYLSPCGCSKPMSGGVKRRITALKNAQENNQVLTLELGGLASGKKRQDELKLETLAEILRVGKVDAVGLSRSDLDIESSILGSFNRLSGYKLLSSVPLTLGNEQLERFLEKGPFLVGSISAPNSAVVAELVHTAALLKKQPILLIGGDKAEAKSIAKDFPDLKLIAYRISGTPPLAVEFQGQTALVTPGDKGRHVVDLTWNDKITSASLLELDHTFGDDPDAKRIYDTYLSRVTSEELLVALPRTEITTFLGSKACGTCHQKEYEIWKNSEHASALDTLEQDKHDRDPECVGCHVVGLDSIKGFQSRTKTPELADVGCESCHGSGVEHSLKPMEQKMPPTTKAVCQSCHNLNHSPTFNWETYWEKIKH